MRSRPFQQVDVFTDTPYRGNPLAVVLDAEGLDDAAMQRFARWTNLSETTFVLPPTDAAADYRVRIFTPGGELPFAGHPTLGTCHAWLRAGGAPTTPGRVVQQCGAGLVQIRRETGHAAGERLAFAAPPLKRSAPSPMLLAKVANALGLKAAQINAAQLLDNGPVWLGLLLADDEAVLSLRPDHRALRELGQKVGVAGVPPAETAPLLIAKSNREARAFGGGAAAVAERGTAPTVGLEVRAFAAPVGVDEDPVTGSLNAGLAQWLIADGHLPARYVAGQGQCLDRDGRVFIERDAADQVWVGGHSVSCVEGRVTL
ncbi:MAG: PhzF family phenazine biosynthesis protein [Proteobacteria bacterium]|nr:PhzF family phenazine biosynthesis protein [Pseudomonadota bacterium]